MKAAIEVEIVPVRVSRLEHDMVMPKYLFHQPMDRRLETDTPRFPDPVIIPGEPFAEVADFLPPPAFSYQNWIVGRARQ